MICPRVLHSFAMFFHLSHLIPGFCLFRRPSQLAAGPATSVAPRRSATSPAPVGQLPSCSARGSCRRRRRCCAPSATRSRGSWGKLGEVGRCFIMFFEWCFCGISFKHVFNILKWLFKIWRKHQGTIQMLLFGRCFLGNGRKPMRSCCACRLSKNMEKRILILIGRKPLQKWDQVGIKHDKMGMVLELRTFQMIYIEHVWHNQFWGSRWSKLMVFEKCLGSDEKLVKPLEFLWSWRWTIHHL